MLGASEPPSKKVGNDESMNSRRGTSKKELLMLLVVGRHLDNFIFRIFLGNIGCNAISFLLTITFCENEKLLSFVSLFFEEGKNLSPSSPQKTDLYVLQSVQCRFTKILRNLKFVISLCYRYEN